MIHKKWIQLDFIKIKALGYIKLKFKMTNLNLSHFHLPFTLKVIFRFSSLAEFTNSETNL